MSNLVMDEPHAVRWARRELKRLMMLDYTKWHWTEDGVFTICGVLIPIGLDLPGTCFPECYDWFEIVDCERCKCSIQSGRETVAGAGAGYTRMEDL